MSDSAAAAPVPPVESTPVETINIATSGRNNRKVKHARGNSGNHAAVASKLAAAAAATRKDAAYLRKSTVVIMAHDENDKQIIKNGSRAHLQHLSSTSSFRPGHQRTRSKNGGLHASFQNNLQAEFSDEHIDRLTLQFKHIPKLAEESTSDLLNPPAHTSHSPTAPSSASNAKDKDSSNRSVDRTLESNFLSDFFDTYHKRVQIAILTATFIWGLYVINDIQKNSQGLRTNFHATLIIRAANCLIGFLCAGALSTTFIRRRKLLMPVVGLAMVTFGLAQIVFGLWDSNELDPAYSLIMIIIPSTSSTLFKQRFIFTVVYQFSLLICYILVTYIFDSFHSASDLVLTALGLFFANILFAMHAYRREFKIRRDFLMKCQLEREEIRSQNLLLRMLPFSAIEKLRDGSQFIYYRHESVSLLFSHIHDFDAHVSAMTAMQVIRMLNSLFIAFDELVDIHGVYKVETIGDVYLVAAGCPMEYARDDHMDAIASFALDMMAASKRFMVEHVRDVKSGSVQVNDPTNKNHGMRKKHGHGIVSKLCPIRLRLGINSGSVISGVVGLKYPRFRFMGDTINSASRMSTTAEADQIQLSTKSYEALTKTYFETTYRGEISVKGKGSMKTYLLLSRVDLLCPPPKHVDQVQKENGTYKAHVKLSQLEDEEDEEGHVATSGGIRLEPAPSGPSKFIKTGSSGTIELQPAELPGMPEMLQKLRVGEKVGVEEESLMEGDEGEGSENSLLDGSRTPSSLRAMEEGLADVLDEPHVSEQVAGSFVDTLLQHAKPHASITISTVTAHHDMEKSSYLKGAESPMDAPAISTASPPKKDLSEASNRPYLQDKHTYSTPKRLVSTSGAGNGGDAEPKTGFESTSVNPLQSPTTSHSTSSKSNKMIITAVQHQHTVKSTRLFSFGPMNAILRPKREWFHYFSQNFITDPVLEYEYRHSYAKDHAYINRTVMNFMWIFLLPLSMYDVFNNTELDVATVGYSWIARGIGIAAGVYYYFNCQKPQYYKKMQLLTGVTVTTVGVAYVWITYLTSALLKAYGVSFVLMQLCLICVFLGCRFRTALISTSIILLNWIVASCIQEGTLPGISSLLVASWFMYLETAWNMEGESRHDFVRFRKLYHERMSTQSFLSNLLPPVVFEGLKREDQALVAHERMDADVFFSDVVGFTSVAASLAPEDVVAILNVMFGTFDELATKYGVYKVETIGDAYVACANVVDIRPDHTKQLVDFALGVQRATKSMYTSTQQQIVIRCGIHTGPVIAGVVGRKMPRYHLFGETVSIAELMEQKGVPGMVAITQAAYDTMPPGSMWEYETQPLEKIVHSDGMILKRYTIVQKVGSAATTPANKDRRNSMRRSLQGSLDRAKMGGSNGNLSLINSSPTSTDDSPLMLPMKPSSRGGAGANSVSVVKMQPSPSVQPVAAPIIAQSDSLLGATVNPTPTTKAAEDSQSGVTHVSLHYRRQSSEQDLNNNEPGSTPTPAAGARVNTTAAFPTKRPNISTPTKGPAPYPAFAPSTPSTTTNATAGTVKPSPSKAKPSVQRVMSGSIVAVPEVYMPGQDDETFMPE